MSAVGVIVLVAGIAVTLLTIAGMAMLTPRGTVGVTAEGSEGQGSDLSPTSARPEPAASARSAEPARG